MLQNHSIEKPLPLELQSYNNKVFSTELNLAHGKDLLADLPQEGGIQLQLRKTQRQGQCDCFTACYCSQGERQVSRKHSIL